MGVEIGYAMMHQKTWGVPFVLWIALCVVLLMANGWSAHQYAQSLRHEASARETLASVQRLVNKAPLVTSAAALKDFWKDGTFASDHELVVMHTDALQRMRSFGVEPKTWSWSPSTSTLTLEYRLARP